MPRGVPLATTQAKQELATERRFHSHLKNDHLALQTRHQRLVALYQALRRALNLEPAVPANTDADHEAARQEIAQEIRRLVEYRTNVAELVDECGPGDATDPSVALQQLRALQERARLRLAQLRESAAVYEDLQRLLRQQLDLHEQATSKLRDEAYRDVSTPVRP